MDEYGRRHGLYLPGGSSGRNRRQSQEAALKAYKAAGVEVYGRVDVLLREEDGAPFVLEINTIPGMTLPACFPRRRRPRWPYEDLCEKIAELSLSPLNNVF
ncbi:MAG: hypothetical protein ACLSUW_10050 [Akkermansia sp.]